MIFRSGFTGSGGDPFKTRGADQGAPFLWLAVLAGPIRYLKAHCVFAGRFALQCRRDLDKEGPVLLSPFEAARAAQHRDTAFRPDGEAVDLYFGGKQDIAAVA